MIFEGLAKRFIAMKAGQSTIAARFTQQESLAVAQVEPPGFEMTRAGRRFSIAYNQTGVTGIAPIQTVPTTTLHWGLSNYDPQKTLFMQTIGAWPVSGTPGVGGIVFVCIYPQSNISGAMAAGFGVMNMNNISQSGNGKSNVIIRAGASIGAIATPTPLLFTPIAFNQPGAVGAGIAGNAIINTEVQGRIAIPPFYGLGITVVALAGTTPLFAPIAEWIEQEVDNET